METAPLTSNYVAIGSVIFMILSHFNVPITNDQTLTIIAGVLGVYGVIKSYLDHKKLKGVAISMGAIKK